MSKPASSSPHGLHGPWSAHSNTSSTSTSNGGKKPMKIQICEPSPIDRARGDPYPEFPCTGSPVDFEDYFDDVVPPTHHSRTLVLCFDGTGDQFDADNSNVVEFFSMLKKDDRTQQMVYYQAGIGTYTIPQIAKPWMAKLSKTMDMMLGVHLDAHVQGGYEFLMQNYEAGDKICIFGFSRGAYTARALAGMIHKIGVIPACNHQQVPFAYKMYTEADEVGWQQSTAFKKAFSIDVKVEFLGVWDTVGSVGIIPRRLPFTASNTHVRYFRHAISLDERRSRFTPNFWHRAHPDHEHLGVQRGEMPVSRKRHNNRQLMELERRHTDMEHPTDVEEVWFAGCHTDVGGGSVVNGTRNNLARIPLRWMIRQCFLTNTGIMFNRQSFRRVGLDPDTLYPVVRPRPPAVCTLASEPGSPAHFIVPSVSTARTLLDDDEEQDFISEEDEDLADALCPMYDQLKLARFWWVLEVLPQTLRFQNDDDTWTRTLHINRGRGRVIPHQSVHGFKVHRTVKLRMEAEADGVKNKKYTPKTKWEVEPIWVD